MAKAFGGLGVTAGLAADRAALTGMVAGQEFFETNTSLLYIYTGTVWQQTTLAGLAAGGGLTGTYPNPTVASISGLTAGGGLTGTYPNPTVASISGLTAGGGLTGTYPNPTVASISGLAAGGDLAGTYPNPTIADSAGQVAYFARSTAPTGWLKANGSLVSRSTYSALFSVIGTSYGAGDGSTTFALPDFRGEFLRSWADGSSTDSGRALHSFQDYDWKGFYQTNTGTNTYSYSHGPVYMGKSIYGSFTGNLFIGYWAAPSAAMGTAWDGSEIRPRNRALLACIKY